MQLRIRDERVVWQEAGGEIVALDLGSSNYLRFNGTGSLLWQRLHGGASREELIDAVVAVYEVDAAEAGRDVDAFTDELVRHGLLSGP